MNTEPKPGLSSAETPQGEQLKRKLNAACDHAGAFTGPLLRAALLRIEHLEADLAAEREGKQ